ncbi:MAG: FAD-binding oxidoreductase [Rhodospirillales bacterium]|nr:FAD-binding oxidoreductase [Rhodospirillales bacterium]
MTVDAALLERLAAVVGPAGCVADAAAMEPYLTEERGLFRGRAAMVVRPATTAEVAEVVRLCAAYRVPLVPQGGNTGLVGGGIPFENGDEIVIALGRMNRIRGLDAANFTITAEAGCILADVQRAAADADRLFPLSLAAEGSCQIGGNIATNAGGVAVLRYGNMRELVLGLEVVLPDGQVWNGLGALRKDNTGYDLKQLFIGAEGTLGIVTAAVLKLFPKPADVQTALVGLADLDRVLELLARVRTASGDAVTAFELIPRIGLDLALRHVAGTADPLDAPHPWYALVELSSSSPAGGLRDILEGTLMAAIDDGVVADAVVAASLEQRSALWRLREVIPEAQKREGGSIKHDVAVPVSTVPAFIRAATADVEAALPGVRVVAFGHLGDGNIHFNLTQPPGADRAAFLGEWERANRIVHDRVAQLGGSISAEHGIGRLKRGELARYKSAVDLELMRKIKSAIDPAGIMNPGKIL